MDYYTVLGVTKTATPEEIKKSYRKLALESHPDRNPDDASAEDKLKKINEAYSVLSDVQKRQSYDRFGIRDRDSNRRPPSSVNMNDMFSSMGVNFGGAARTPGQRKGADINIRLGVTLATAVLGGVEDIHITISDACFTCKGLGATEHDVCEPCNGQGVTHFMVNNMKLSTTCRQCGGMGKFALDVCATCEGSATVQADRNFKVTIPAGIKHGQKLALRGQGQSGVGGGSKGDAYVNIQVIYPTDLDDNEKEFLRKLDAKIK